MISLSEEISTLTTIPNNQITKLLKDMELCIDYNVKEAYTNANGKDTSIEFDLVFGRLIVGINSTKQEIHYKFVPSQSLHRTLQCLNDKDVLSKALEDAISSKFLRFYKELM